MEDDPQGNSVRGRVSDLPMPVTRPRRQSMPVRIAIQVLCRDAVVHDLCLAKPRTIIVGEGESCDLRVPARFAGAPRWALVTTDRRGIPELVVPCGSRAYVDLPGPGAPKSGPYRSHGPRVQPCTAHQRVPLLPGTQVVLYLAGLTYLVTAFDAHPFRSRAAPWQVMGGIAVSILVHTLFATVVAFVSPDLADDAEELPIRTLPAVRCETPSRPLINEADWRRQGRWRAAPPEIVGVIDREQAPPGPSPLERGMTAVSESAEHAGKQSLASPTRLVAPPTRTVESPTSTIAILSPGNSFARARRRLQAGERPDPNDVRVEDVSYALAARQPATATEAVQVSLDALRSPDDSDHTFVRVLMRARAVPPTIRNRVIVVESAEGMSGGEALRIARRLTADVNYAVVSYGDAARVESAWSRDRSPSRMVNALQSTTRRLHRDGTLALDEALRAAARLACTAPGGGADTDVAIVWQHSVAFASTASARWTEEAQRCDLHALSTVHVGNGDAALAGELSSWGLGRHLVTMPHGGDLSDIDRPGDPLAPDVAADVELRVTFDPASVHSYRLIGREQAADPLWRPGSGSGAASTMRSGETAIAVYDVETAPGAWPAVRATVSFREWPTGAPHEVTSDLAPGDCHVRPYDAPAELRADVAATGLGELLRESPYATAWSADTLLRLAGRTPRSAALRDLLQRYVTAVARRPVVARGPGSRAAR